jgi:two-component system cell cycle response regulator
MRKYESLLLQQIYMTFDNWREQESKISHTEIYRFLHSMKGTAPTIGRLDWGEVAGKLLEPLEEESERLWDLAEIEEYMAELLEITVGQSVSHELAATSVLEEQRVESSEVSERKDSLILVVDDDITMLKMVKGVLEEQGWTVLATTEADKAIQWFYGMKPDCVILDLVLPQKDGFEVLTSLQKQSELFLIPIIMMSGKSDKTSRLQSYEAGADDFIEKPWDPQELIVRVKRQLDRRKLIRRMLLKDELTGAYNRAFLDEELGRQIFEFRRSRESFVIAAIDIDDFQAYNIKHGYAAGDGLLKKCADLITDQIRETDYLVRDQADRYYVLMPKADVKHAAKLFQRIQETFQEKLACRFTSVLFEVVEYEITPELCLKAADKGMDEAKKSHPGSVQGIDPTHFEKIAKGKVRIAVIDDDALIRRMLEKQFADLGRGRVDIEVRGFTDGEHFFDDNWHKQPGMVIVLLDRMMPRMNGMEVLHRLQDYYDRRRYIIIMLTRVSNEEEIAQAIEAGTDDYVTKPFSLVELEARIRRLIKGLKK